MSSGKLLLQYSRKYPVLIMLTILLGFSGALFNGVSTTLIVPIILNLLGQPISYEGFPPIIQTIFTPFSGIPESYRLLAMAGSILLAIILKNVATYASALSTGALTRALASDLRERGLKLLLEVDLNFFHRRKVGDLINSLGGEVGRTANAISTAISMIINAVTVLVFVGLLISISWQITLASTVLMGLVWLVNQYAIARSKRYGKLLSDMSAAYSVSLLEALNGIRLVKSTGNEAKEYEKISKLIREREKVDFQSQANFSAIPCLNEVSSIIALMLIVVFARLFFAAEVQALSTILLTYLLILFRVLPLIGTLNGARSRLANSAASVEIIDDFLKRHNKPFMQSGAIAFSGLQQGIHFNRISFAYPESDRQELVLKDVDLYLPKGTTLALVGASGAGKSTMADLLPRFYDPVSGSILLDDRDLREFDIVKLRKSMGIVSQDTFLFNDTVRNNIAYSRLDATDAEIIAAAKRANAYEFITRLPNGLETLIGDRGVMLSGGQRQRLAIARALLQNPEILILDEATSALDTVSERLVQAALDDLSRDRTTLVIAHRLSTVQKAHQIAVLEKGQVVELGTHEELLKQEGHYARLYSMQFSENKPEEAAALVAEEDELTLIAPSPATITKTSYELRTKLNVMIGSLQLLVDGIVDNPQEQMELTTEAYHSAVRLLETLEDFEDSTHTAKNKQRP